MTDCSLIIVDMADWLSPGCSLFWRVWTTDWSSIGGWLWLWLRLLDWLMGHHCLMDWFDIWWIRRSIDIRQWGRLIVCGWSNPRPFVMADRTSGYRYYDANAGQGTLSWFKFLKFETEIGISDDRQDIAVRSRSMAISRNASARMAGPSHGMCSGNANANLCCVRLIRIG